MIQNDLVRKKAIFQTQRPELIPGFHTSDGEN